MIGVTLLNRYRLDAELGHGGMGIVYRAHDLLLDRDVAVKVLSDAGLGTEGRAQLLREAQAAARLNHPNIVTVYDAGETAPANGSSGTPFIVMELAEGQTLYDQRPASLEATLAVARQICAALEHAHSHGIIHRDLKPENVIIVPSPPAPLPVGDREASPEAKRSGEGLGVRVKLTDFGLARNISHLTPSGPLVGTVFYLAPEQALGQDVDHRADLYALGVLLYELTTGQLPFDADDALTVIAQHLNAPVTPPRTHAPTLPPALDALIVALLSKQPEHRPASAAAVRETLDRIARHTGPLPRVTAPRHNLPIQVTRFIGREKEMAEVTHYLTPTPDLAPHPDSFGAIPPPSSGAFRQERREGPGWGVRLLTLTGSGGTGKTRLALQVAASVLDFFPDGVWLVELAPLSDPALVPQSVAAELRVREEPGAPLTKTLTEALHHKTLLLILDNCEHLIAACARLAEAILRACPNVKMLATSREALGIPGETSLRIPSLSLPEAPQPTLAALAESEAVQLFVDRAVAVRADFALNGVNASAIAQIVHQLDGVPLALELAAARIRAMTVEQIAERLDDRFRLLTGGSRTALPRQQTLRALIDWSWDLLSDAERVLLRRLAVFWAGWTLEAAEVVCADKDEGERRKDEFHPSSFILHPSDILDLLTHLVDKSLVIVEAQNEGVRYRLLETIRQYAREKLLEAGEAEIRRVRDRHLAFFAQLADEAAPALRRAEQLDWLARLETEHDNLRAAMKWAKGSGAVEPGLRLAGGLARFWYLHGYWNEGREWLSGMLAQIKPETPISEAIQRARARALYGMAALMDESGEDIPLYEESLALSRAVGDRWGTAFSLRGLGATHWSRGDVEQTAPLLNESLALFRDLGDEWGIAVVYFNLGWVWFYDEDQRAEGTWAEGLALFRQSGDRWGIAVTLGALGYIARLRGDYARAAALSEESLSLFRELGDKAGIAVSLSRLGQVAFRRSDYPQAQMFIEEGLILQRELGDQNGMALSFSLLGLTACYRGEYARAKAWLEDSLALFRESSDSSGTAYAQGYLAFVAYQQGDLAQAVSLWQDSLIRHQQLDDKVNVGFALNGLGLTAFRQGDYDLAQQHVEAGLRHYREVGDKRYIAFGLNDLAWIMHGRGDHARARALFKESLTLRKETGERQGIAEGLEGLALTAASPQRAAWLFGAAEALREAIGAPVPPVERDDHKQAITAVRAKLDESAFNAAWAEGRAAPPDKAVKHALKDETI
jgi:non-specific serine/threonine protein kinase